MNRPKAAHGELVVVGSGIQLARHLGRRAESEIRAVERVYVLVDSFAMDGLMRIRPDCIGLAPY